MTPNSPYITLQHEDWIGTITMCNPGKHNCLSEVLIEDLCSVLDELKQKDTRVVILRAQPGAKVFSAGHDVRELPTNGRDPLTYDDPLRKVVRAVEYFPHPVIAMIEGTVWGGACELVMSCDLVIACEETTFAITPSKIGMPYNISGVQNFMNAGSLALCREMLFTSQPVGSKRLVEAHIINHAVPHQELEAKTMEIAQQIASMSPRVNSLLKEELRLLSAAHQLRPETYERVQAMRRECYDSADYQEGIRAFFERRAPQFKGK